MLAAETFIMRARRFVTSGYRLLDEDIERPLPDGTRQYLKANAFGELHEGYLTHMWFTMQDVTLHRVAASLAAAEQSSLRETEDLQDYAFWVLDWQAFRMLDSGPAFEQLWHVSQPELHHDPLARGHGSAGMWRRSQKRARCMPPPAMQRNRPVTT
jgi:hypothetical protein